MKEHLDKVKQATTRSLTRNVITALNDARLQIEAQAMRFAGAKLPPIEEESPGVADRFTRNLFHYFDSLTASQAKDSEIEPDSYDNLSLVDHDYLEAMIAMEGMVKQMRDKEFKGVKSFITRLESMFPNVRVDSANNPLDPEQIGDCFNEAIRPLGLKAHYLLTIYREFNKTVFGNYEQIIDEANDVLIEVGVLPELDITAEERERRKTRRTQARAQLEAELQAKAEAEQEEVAARGSRPAAKPATQTETDSPPPGSATSKSNAEMFAMMQTLVKSLAQKQGGDSNLAVSGSAVSSANTADLAAQQEELRNQQNKLMGMLTEIQSSMLATGGNGAPANAAAIGKSINASLKAGQDRGELQGIDPQSSDVINLVTMLYEAIWNDKALPVVMKELIGRTQISIMKVALADTDFFNNENHPGRAVLNELALAGIAWTETENLDSDPAYGEVKRLVERLLSEPQASNAFLQELADQLRDFRGRQTGTDHKLEQRVRTGGNTPDNMDDINAYVTQKINERILKGYLDPAIRNLLDTYIHNFLVKLVLKEGPEGKSWKPVMSTIDVLLWTVQAEKQPGDRDRYNRINPRLLDNLGKALEIGGASKTKITKFMRQLKQIQEYTFHKAEEEGVKASSTNATREELAASSLSEPEPLPRNDPHLRRIDKLPIGTWLEFRSVLGKPVRCALVAKIDSIDKLFFANKEGRKIAELTRMRLAAELKTGNAKIVSEGSLVNRAMESVINNLKDNTPGSGSAQATA